MISNEQFTGEKYQGAGWLQRRSSGQTLCLLAVKIANVLGQVYSGIYHLTDTCTRSLDSLKLTNTEYSITVYGEMATYDNSLLTRLLLCCQAAGLNVSIGGSRKGYLKLTFKSGRSAQPHIDHLNTIVDLESLADMDIPGWRLQLETANRHHYINNRKSLHTVVLKASDSSITGIDRKSDYIGMIRIKDIVSLAHSACCRAAIQGRCPTGFGQLTIFYTQRSRTATTIMDGHPTPAQTIENLRPFWDIDYTRLD